MLSRSHHKVVDFSTTEKKLNVKPIFSFDLNIKLRASIILTSYLDIVAEIFKFSWDVHLSTVAYCGKSHES